MPSYDYTCTKHPGRHLSVFLTYAEKDEYTPKCGPKCGLVMVQVYSPPVAHFTGAGFTRRNTNTHGNAGIDHTDWRSSETWPGNPDKKVKVHKRMTSDDFRKKAI